MGVSPWDLPLLSDANKYSNFQCFLQSVTPTLPSHKACVPVLNGAPKPLCQEIVDTFSLSSLWEFYADRSCYGTGVPILLSNGENVVQFYCPSLSALQVFTEKPSSPLRMLGKSCMTEQDNGSWSDESESDELSMSLSNDSSKSSDFASDDSAIDHDGDSLGELYCQYNETLCPYKRDPLNKKINQLAQEYPGLMKFQSTDLSPYSWIAIAWYPIYQIPVTKNMKGLSACFVTYHSLSSLKGPLIFPENRVSTTFYDAANAYAKEKHQKFPALNCAGKAKGAAARGEVSVPPFAVAAHKASDEIWANPAVFEEERINSGVNAASSWLKRVNFRHHDFGFFMSHRNVV